MCQLPITAFFGTSYTLGYNPVNKEISYTTFGVGKALCILNDSNAQTSTSGTLLVFTYDAGSVITDPLGWRTGGGSNTHIVPTIAGYYSISSYASCPSSSYYKSWRIYKNGLLQESITSTTDTERAGVTQILYCNGTTDYLQCGFFQASGVNRSINSKFVYVNFVGSG